MSATPMKLEDALRLNGYTIEREAAPGFTIALPGSAGSIVVPPMLRAKLTWQRDTPPWLSAAFYLDKMPAFHPDYRPVMLSHLLDTYRQRRLSYDTLDEFGLAVVRWSNLHLGPASVLNRRYVLAARDLPLDTVDMLYDGTRNEETAGTATNSDTSAVDNTSSDTTNANSSDTSSTTVKGRNVGSDYPMGQIAGSLDYASNATDQVSDTDGTGSGTTAAEREATARMEAEGSSTGATTGTRDETDHHTEKGRSGRTIAELVSEQLELIYNADLEFTELAGSLFLSVMDRSENESSTPGGFGYGYRSWGW